MKVGNLYIPIMILRILTATGICWVVGRMMNSSENWRLVAITGIYFLVLGFISTTGVNPTYRDFFLSVGREN